jgi:CTP synthase
MAHRHRRCRAPTEESDLGGTMRLGLQDQRIKPGSTLAREL